MEMTLKTIRPSFRDTLRHALRTANFWRRWLVLASDFSIMLVVCASGQISEAWRRPLYDGFEANDFSASGGLYFKRNPEQDAGTIEFQNQVTYSGKGALKLTVR